MGNRAYTKKAVETDILQKSARKCAFCFGIDQDVREKPGQIAHVDGDNSNSNLENLVWLCLYHHDRYDGATSQSKGLTRHELQGYRNGLYEFVKNLRSTLTLESLQNTIGAGSAQLDAAPIDMRSAATFQEHIIRSYTAYFSNQLPVRDRRTTLQIEKGRESYEGFDPDQQFKELIGMQVNWEVFVLDVLRIVARDKDFLIVKSHLKSGGTQVDWYFDVAFEDKLSKLEKYDTMIAKGVVTPDLYLANCEFVGVKPSTDPEIIYDS